MKVINKLLDFVRKNSGAMDVALNRMAVDVERLSKAQVPLKHGQLRSSGSHVKNGPLSYSVSYNKKYARFQEFGGDDKRVVKNYSKPGTKSFYLRDAGKEIAKNALNYIKQEVQSIRI